jgi:hypothetical protein
MTIHHRPIGERVDWLLELARRHTTDFRSPEAYLARQRYRTLHPSAVVVLKCMDGRINIPVVTNTPLGIIQPFRNLGGMFDLGWPHLGEVLASHVQRMVTEGRRVLIIITYHFSRGSAQRGCAGFDYNTEAAITHTRAIKHQAEQIFGKAHATVYPIICGFETDEDALLLHGSDDELLDLSTITAEQIPSINQRISELYPDMPEQMRDDLSRLIIGNLEWISHVRSASRQLEISHREWMICLGRGFDFLHTPNLALIIGPYSPNLADPIRKAAAIIEANMNAGRIPDDGFLLFASVPYEEIGIDQARAELKSHFLADYAADVIRSDFPDLAKKMHSLTAVISWLSRELNILEQS